MTTTATLDDLATALGGTQLFSEMSKKEVRSIARHARVVRHSAGEVITAEGRWGAGFHLVLDGTAVVQTHHGDVRVRPGQYFGEISLIDGKPRSATVRAETDITTAVVAPWEFEPLLQEHPAMAIGLLRGLCAHVRAQDGLPVQ